MGNCLVTKLNGIVNNDNLPVYNTTKAEVFAAPGVPSTSDHYVAIVTLIDGTRTTFNVPAEYPQPNASHVANGDYDFTILARYDIKDITVGYNVKLKDESELKYLTNLIYYNSSSNERKKLELSDIENLTKLEKFYIYATSSHGNILSFSNLTKLDTMWIFGCPYINGTLESLVEAQCVLRTSGTLAVRSDAATPCTFHSETLGEVKVTFSNTGAIVYNNNNVQLAEYVKSTGTWTYA